MNKKIITVLLGAALTLSLSGCGTSQSNNNATKSNKDSLMKRMQTGNQKSLASTFQDEFNGFTKIEQDISNGDYISATTLVKNLHDEFTAAILPPLTDKKGKTYAENIHEKYNELQDAISSKNNSKIKKLINVNRENLNTIVPILGVSIEGY